MRFKNKVVVITGGTGGIGTSLVKGFANEGANIVFNYVKNHDGAKKLISEIGGESNSHLAIKADVTDELQVCSLYNKLLDRFGKIDILVNNAGIYQDSSVKNMTGKMWKKVITTNLDGSFFCTKHAIEPMIKNGFGRIINISSVVGQTSSFGTSNYSASKAGLDGFTRSVATEVARKEITVNSLSLGFIEAGMLLNLPDSIKSNILKKIPVGRWGKLEEVVETVFFLSSENSAYITGQVINMNGGYYM